MRKEMVIAAAALAICLWAGAALAGGGGKDALYKCLNAATRSLVGEVYASGGASKREIVEACEQKFPNGCSGGCMGCTQLPATKSYICEDGAGNQDIYND
ncbi:MAG: hypothetical protein H0S85_10225 [Desulfovibrionaceae bacterium]|jgi:hypothetical protein|nr:hypothetical protein [Desulfovibrionaceae bacterium]